MPRLDQETQKRLEPKKMESCKRALEYLGYKVEKIGTAELNFIYNGNKITFFPYSGWHSGKGITAGRGFNNLKKQLT